MIGKEYRIRVSIKNNLLLSAIEACGYATIADFARDADVNQSTISAMINLKFAPLMQSGEFTRAAKQVMETLGAAPSDLWSAEQLNMSLGKSFVDRECGKAELIAALGVSSTELVGFSTPEEALHHGDQVRVVNDVISSLTPREEKVLIMRFGLQGVESKTLDDVGLAFDVTRERIRQIEAKALRKLRHPSRSNQLLEMEGLPLKEKKKLEWE